MPSRYAGSVRAPQLPPGAEWIGPRFELADLRGKIVVLDFWTSCCINCLHILPNLHLIESRHPEEVIVIGVHSAKFPAEQRIENVRAAVDRLDIRHPVVSDPDHAIWDAYAVNAWPTLMVIDPRGRVIGKQSGEFELETLDQFLVEAIAEFDSEGLIDRRPLAVQPTRLDQTGVLRYPEKILADHATDRLYIADTGHHRLVVTDLSGQIRRTIGSGEAGIADGAATAASFNRPHGLALSPEGDRLAVADTGNHSLRVIDLHTGFVTTIAGTGEEGWDRSAGPGLQTRLASPWDIIWREDGIWITMAGWHQIWRYTPENDNIAPEAGTGAESIHDGTLAEATFAQPSGITAVDGVFYIADSESSSIRRVDPGEDRVQRLVGRGLFYFGDLDARGDSVRLQHPLGVAAAAREGGKTVIYLADSYNNKIKRLDPETRTVATIFGAGDAGADDGPGDEATFWELGGLSLAGNRLYIADTNNHAVRVGDLADGTVHTLRLTAPGG